MCVCLGFLDAAWQLTTPLRLFLVSPRGKICIWLPQLFSFCDPFEIPIWSWKAKPITIKLFTICNRPADITPPEAGTVEVTQVDPESLSIKWAGFSEPDGDMDHFAVCVGRRPGGQDIVGCTKRNSGTTSISVGGLAFTELAKVFVTIIAINAEAMETPGIASLLVDTTAPAVQLFGVARTWDGAYIHSRSTPSPMSTVNGSAAAFHSYADPIAARFLVVERSSASIDSLEFCLGTAAGDDNVLAWDDVGYTEAMANKSLDWYTLEVSTPNLTTGQVYWLSVASMNSVGLRQVFSSVPIVVDLTPPVPGDVWETWSADARDIEFTPVYHRVEVEWRGWYDTETPIVRYRWRLVADDGSLPVPWTDVQLEQQAAAYGLTLQDGVRYSVEVEATNAAGRSSLRGTDGFVVDKSGPQFADVLDLVPGPPYSDEPCDEGSAPSEQCPSIGLADQGNDTRTGLPAVRPDELLSAAQRAALERDYVSALPALAVRFEAWDAHSSLVSLSIGLGTARGKVDLMPPRPLPLHVRSATVVTRYGAAFPRYTTMYATVRARNMAGLELFASTDGILIDDTPPSADPNRLTDQLETGPFALADREFQSSVDTLGAAWPNAFSDTAAPLAYYKVAVSNVTEGETPTPNVRAFGLVEGGASVASTVVQGLKLQHGGHYFVGVQGCNAADLCAELWTNGITVDATPPLAGVAVVAPADGALLGFYKESHQADAFASWRQVLYASWSGFSDPESGMASYALVGTSSFGLPVSPTRRVSGTARRTWVVPRRRLRHSRSYKLQLTARNRGGAEVDTFTQSVRIDHQAPRFTGLVSVRDLDYPEQSEVQHRRQDGTIVRALNSTQSVLEVTWRVRDRVSGIDSCVVQLGTLPGRTDVSQGVPGEATSGTSWRATTEGVVLPQGFLIYTLVRCCDRVGWCTRRPARYPFIVDAAGPRASVVADGVVPAQDADFQPIDSFLFGAWAAFTDALTSVVEYRVSYGTGPCSNLQVPFTSVGLQRLAQWRSLSLQSGTTYFVCVQALDSVGHVTQVSSDGVTVDLTRPPRPVVSVSSSSSAGAAQASTVYARSDTPLWVHWTAIPDPESGLRRYEVALVRVGSGLSVGDAGVTWIHVAQRTSAVFSVRDAQHGDAFTAFVRVQNQVGMTSNGTASNVVLVDNTPPECSVGIGANALEDAAMLASAGGSGIVFASSLTFHYACTEDTQLASLAWGVGIVQGHSVIGYISHSLPVGGVTTRVNVTSVDATSRVDVVAYSGWSMYLTIRATNAANEETVLATNTAIVLDATPPVVYRRARNGATGVSRSVWGRLDSVDCRWGMFDAESGPVSYRVGVAIGSSPVDDTAATTHSAITNASTLAVAMTPLTQLDSATSATLGGIAPGALRHGEVYHCVAEATNQAGLVTVTRASGFVVDTSPPVCTYARVGSAVAHTAFHGSSLPMEVYFACADPESSIASYELTAYNATGHMVASPTRLGTRTSGAVTGLAVVDGAVYSFLVTATNGVGLTANASTAMVVVDATPPRSTMAGGVTPTVSLIAAPQLQGFTLQWPNSAWVDAESGPVSLSLQLGTRPGLDDVVAATAFSAACVADAGATCSVDLPASATEGGGGYTSGAAHYATVCATNGAQRRSCAQSQAVVFDDSAPVYTAALYPPFGVRLTLPSGVTEQAGFPASAESVAATVSLIHFSDPDSGVVQLVVELLSRPDSGSAWAVEASVTLGEGQVGSVHEHTFTGLALDDGTEVAARITATNGFGIDAAPTESPVAVLALTTLVAGVVKDGADPSSGDVDYFWQTTAVHSHWEGFMSPLGNALDYEYCLGTLPGLCDVVARRAARPVPGDAVMGDAGLDLAVADGTLVFATVVATDASLGVSVNVTSNGVLLDESPPVVLRVGVGAPLDDAPEHQNFTTSPVWVHWTASDAQSGLATCTVEAFRGLSDIPASVSVTVDGATVTAVPLPSTVVEGDAITARVTCTNKAGLTAHASSPPSIVEDSPPAAGTVTTTASIQSDTSTIAVAWSGFADPHSALLSYTVCAGSAGGLCDIWESASLPASQEQVEATGLSLPHGSTVWLTVEATNKAGMTTTVSPTGPILIDATAPAITACRVGEATADATAIITPDAVTVSWDALVDAESGVSSIKVWLGSSPGSGNIAVAGVDVDALGATVAGLHLSSGTTLYASVEAVNGAGGSTRCHAPSVPVVFAGPATGMVVDGPSMASDEQLRGPGTVAASWEPFHQPLGSVVSYEWAVCAVVDTMDCPLPWTRVGNVTTASSDGLAISPGVTYQSLVRATSSFGLVSDTATSNGNAPPHTHRALSTTNN